MSNFTGYNNFMRTHRGEDSEDDEEHDEEHDDEHDEEHDDDDDDDDDEDNDEAMHESSNNDCWLDDICTIFVLKSYKWNDKYLSTTKSGSLMTEGPIIILKHVYIHQMNVLISWITLMNFKLAVLRISRILRYWICCFSLSCVLNADNCGEAQVRHHAEVFQSGQSYVSWARGAGQGWHRYTRVQVDGVISKRKFISRPTKTNTTCGTAPSTFQVLYNNLELHENICKFGIVWGQLAMGMNEFNMIPIPGNIYLAGHVRVSQKENAGTLQSPESTLTMYTTMYLLYIWLTQRQHMGNKYSSTASVHKPKHFISSV